MTILVWHNDAHFQVELRVTRGTTAVGFEVVSFTPWPETAWLRRTILSKALELAAKAAKAVVTS